MSAPTDSSGISSSENILPDVRMLRLAITARWHRPTHLPPAVVANVLRGGFNLTFRRLVCQPEWMDNACQPCPLYAECPYGQIFEPSPMAGADRLRKQSNLPRPFVLKPPRTAADGAAGQGRSRAASKTHLRFGLVLFGSAIDYLPHFAVTLGELGRCGLGRDRVPFSVEAIDAVHPQGTEPLYDPDGHRLQLPSRLTTRGELAAQAGPSTRSVALDHPIRQTRVQGTDSPVREIRRRQLTSLGILPPNGQGQQAPDGADARSAQALRPLPLRLRFVMPTLIKTGSRLDERGHPVPAREVRDRPPFGILIRRLRDRLAALSAFFGAEPWERDDFAQLGQRADEVELIESDTQWQHRTRRSSRTRQRHQISGLTGTAVYRFPSSEHLAELLPLLRFGELMHVGKHAVWGNGWLEVEEG